MHQQPLHAYGRCLDLLAPIDTGLILDSEEKFYIVHTGGIEMYRYAAGFSKVFTKNEYCFHYAHLIQRRRTAMYMKDPERPRWYF